MILKFFTFRAVTTSGVLQILNIGGSITHSLRTIKRQKFQMVNAAINKLRNWTSPLTNVSRTGVRLHTHCQKMLLWRSPQSNMFEFYRLGINMDSIWPWQPPVLFHDDHHKYFHVNFGFNTTIFDQFHDTIRRKDREYGVDIFGGKGRAAKPRKE